MGLVHFGSGVPEGRRGDRFSLWPGILHSMAILPHYSQGGSQEAACLERAGWMSGEWSVNSGLLWEGSDEFPVNQWPVPGH